MTQTAGNYAKALFELSVPEQALLETEKLLKAESRLMEALKNPTVSLTEKERVADRIFPEETEILYKDSLPPWTCGTSF